jgi:hypothetical protein
MDLLRAHRENVQMLVGVEPAMRFANALYQAWAIGAGERVQHWDRLPVEIRAGWIAAADFCEMYTRVLEIDAIVRS